MKRLIYFALVAACTSETTSTPQQVDTNSYTLRIENVAPWKVLKSGTVGAMPIGPLETVEIRFTAGKGHAITFATMLGESNDWFFAPGPDGIPVFDASGNPNAGDVTKYIKLWDAGTEIDQELGVGDATAPQQPSPNYGPRDSNPLVREVSGLTVSAIVQVKLVPRGDREFSLMIMNCHDTFHLSPLAWALHIMPAPLFTPGEPDRGEGLEALAEDGNPMELGRSLAATTGFHTPLSPGVVVVHRERAPLFAVGEPDYGEGLERIAEDGDPSELAAMATAVFDTPLGASKPGPAMPGQAYEIAIDVATGDRISFATMYGMSNDWFFAPTPEGLELATGDVTKYIALYDAGTEIDQEIGIGLFTAPQQPAPNTGPKDPNDSVRAAAYAVPTTSHIRVTLESR